MAPWLRTLLQALYLILGGIIGGGGAVVTTRLCGCDRPPIVDPPSPPPPQPPANPVDPAGATAKFYMGGVGCTCTVLAHRPAPGKYYLLCAAHCVRGGPGFGSAKLKDGRVLQWKLVNTDAKADLSLLVCDGPDGLPVARISPYSPEANTKIWHQGFGVDRPGNKESGTIVDGPDANGQMRMRLSVSSGDSGSGIFRTDTGEIVSVVCCGNNQFTWGGGPVAINRLVHGASEWWDALPDWRPHPIPQKNGAGKHGKD